MKNTEAVITGLGVVAPNGVGKEDFLQALFSGTSAISEISNFDVSKFSVKLAGEVKNFEPKNYLEPKGLRNLDRSALFLLVATKLALDESNLKIDLSNTDDFGVVTGTTFSHLCPIVEFDKEVFSEGLDFANPALFPSTVVNAASSYVSIRFNIQGFNTTISTGYTSGLEALKYSLYALKTGKAKNILCAGVDTLNPSLYFGLYQLGYMAGIKGVALSCPFDKRRNGPVPAEGAVVLSVEDIQTAKARDAKIFARVRSVASYFDGAKMGRISTEGEGLQKSIKMALDQAKIMPGDIDYISSCANSTLDLDSVEVKALKKIFGQNLKKIPLSSIKSMIGETFSASAGMQIASCLGAFSHGIIVPTINYQESDPSCDIDCVANKSQKKDVKFALVVSSGPGGYNSAAVLENPSLRGSTSLCSV